MSWEIRIMMLRSRIFRALPAGQTHDVFARTRGIVACHASRRTGQ